jgi:hypothetical protein
MHELIELADLDLRYEVCSLGDPACEKRLLNSILEKGIREPLLGIDGDDAKILLDGFKRRRCAKKLGIGIAPWRSMGTDAIEAIAGLMRLADARKPGLLEQAAWIDELKGSFGMSGAQVASLLEKSPAWVSVRSGILASMSDKVRGRIFKGEFPARSFIYTLRKFTRVNRGRDDRIERFVESVSGKRLGVRDIGLLAEGYFNGSDEFRRQIEDGNAAWCLNSLKEPACSPDCTKRELEMLANLEGTGKCMKRFLADCGDCDRRSGSFFAQANLLSANILKIKDAFSKEMRRLHDRSRQAQSDFLPSE